MRFSFRVAVLLLVCCSLRPAFADDAIIADGSAAVSSKLLKFAL
jgi:hypothetical protein